MKNNYLSIYNELIQVNNLSTPRHPYARIGVLAGKNLYYMIEISTYAIMYRRFSLLLNVAIIFDEALEFDIYRRQKKQQVIMF